jgi:hypothetical protein
MVSRLDANLLGSFDFRALWTGACANWLKTFAERSRIEETWLAGLHNARHRRQGLSPILTISRPFSTSGFGRKRLRPPNTPQGGTNRLNAIALGEMTFWIAGCLFHGSLMV